MVHGLESAGMAGRIQISEAIRHALGGYIGTTDAHRHDVKGIGTITSYFTD